MKIDGILDTIEKALKALEIKYRVDRAENIAIYRLLSADTNDHFALHCAVRAEEDGYHCIAEYQLKIKESRIDEVAKYICAINPRLKIGALQIDMETGEVSYKNYQALGGDVTCDLDVSVIRRCILATWILSDDFYRDMQSIYNEEVSGAFAANARNKSIKDMAR